MRLFRAGWFPVAGMLSAVCVAQTGGVSTGVPAAPSITITEGQNGQTVAVPVGSDVAVTFVAAGGTGYGWYLTPMTSGVAVPGDQDNTAVSPGLAGGPMKTVFHYQIKSAGSVTLNYSFMRPWEKTTPPAKTFTVTLQAK